MNFEEKWASDEDRLIREADSLGELLARMKSHFSALPVDDRIWEKLFNQAHKLPPTLAGFPLWIGFPVDQSQSSAILDVSLLGETYSADFLKRKAASENRDSPTDVIASILEMTGMQDPHLRDIVGNRVLVEYSIQPDEQVNRGPGVYLYPVMATLPGTPSAERLSDFRLAYGALTSAMLRNLDEHQRNLADHAYRSLDRDARIGAMGGYLSCREPLGFTMLGFNNARDVVEYLERIEWPGSKFEISSVLEGLEMRGALSQMQFGVRLDLGKTALEPTLELQIFSANTIYQSSGWFKDRECWMHLMEGLREEGLAQPDHLSGLTDWSSGAKALFGRSGPLLLLQRIHHFAFLLESDGSLRVNAHVFLLVTR